ncbi:hypothetical protein CYMTET_43859 [Cymbomonas tetramitiformis]|uniref:Uncharacterized protein n=1 Tax=Cymbomonas tetramitiformis TaxID=36881 RepID=A0AAE0F192_9CHLO|nr:hypothetical protein CYMTET_43859 [Cymbomonas tetramitiformis]
MFLEKRRLARMQSSSLLKFGFQRNVNPEAVNPDPQMKRPEVRTRFGNNEERWERLMSGVLNRMWNARRKVKGRPPTKAIKGRTQGFGDARFESWFENDDWEAADYLPTDGVDDETAAALPACDVARYQWQPLKKLMATTEYNRKVKDLWPWIKHRQVPGGLTGDAQKADVDGTGPIKVGLRSESQEYIAGLVTEQLREGVEYQSILFNFSLSHVKPLLCKWTLTVYEKFKNDVPARARGWAKCRISEALLAATREKARALNAEDEGEREPSPDTDDVDEIERLSEEMDLRGVSADSVSQKRARQERGATVSKRQKQGGSEAAGPSRTRLTDDSSSEDGEDARGYDSDASEGMNFTLEDFGNADAREFFIVKASQRDELTFQFKIANRLSPLLTLLECMEVDLSEGKMTQAFYKPTSTAFVGHNKKQQVSIQSVSRAHAFSDCKHKITETVKFDGDTIFWAWEEDENDSVGCIPREQAHELHDLLARAMKAQRARKCAVGADSDQDSE